MNIAAANDRYSDRLKDELDDLADAAERVHDRSEWMPTDMDEAENMIEAITANLGADFWRTFDRMNDADPERREAAREAMAKAFNNAKWQRCYDIAGDA